MSLYQLPEIKFPKIKALKKGKRKFSFAKFWKNKIVIVFFIVLTSFVFGMAGGFFTGAYFYLEAKDYLSQMKVELPEWPGEKIIEKETIIEYHAQASQEDAIIKVAKEVSPLVVSIIITKDLPVFEKHYYDPFEGSPFEDLFEPEEIPGYEKKGTEKKQVGGGTGFIISEDGIVVTNKHVAEDKDADYTVLMNDGEKFSATVLARDPIKDLALLKIKSEKRFKPVHLGNSDNLQPGQTVIAIGYALGEFQNTVSVGVVSGLKRTVTASGGGISETLENLIQTDAAINRGNSGGPLLNLKGEVIGVNVAMAPVAQSIGFSIPINEAKKAIEQVKQFGKIVYPFLGIRYAMITDYLQEENSLPVDYGAWIVKGEGEEQAITPGSAADKAGLQENDIVLEFNKEKITTENSLAKIIQQYNPGDKISLKILRNGKEKIIKLVLGERGE